MVLATARKSRGEGGALPRGYTCRVTRPGSHRIARCHHGVRKRRSNHQGSWCDAVQSMWCPQQSEPRMPRTGLPCGLTILRQESKPSCPSQAGERFQPTTKSPHLAPISACPDTPQSTHLVQVGRSSPRLRRRAVRGDRPTVVLLRSPVDRTPLVLRGAIAVVGLRIFSVFLLHGVAPCPWFELEHAVRWAVRIHRSLLSGRPTGPAVGRSRQEVLCYPRSWEFSTRT